MALPRNITKEHLLKALQKIDSEGVPTGAQSKYFDVVYDGKAYPPKLVVSYANIFANEVELNRTSFEGGEKTECFKLLRKNGFLIESKVDEFFPTLMQFLEQANSPILSLKVKDFPKLYKGLKVTVSFGKGNRAEIPWIAFLREGQTVSKGIYPVFLYYREYKLLILAYGVSETNLPEFLWNIEAKSVYEIVEGKYFKEARRYGDSLVFAHYQLDFDDPDYELNAVDIEKDLNQLIKIYKNLPLKEMTTDIIKGNKQRSKLELFNYKAFKRDTDAANLKFSNQLIIRFVASLCTKPFVILTGLAGSGKTKIAQAFSEWICESNDQICLVPVGADWTNREPLLGFPSALDPKAYIKPDNMVVDLLLNASKPENSHKPYFLILDEMNLSHVERYFSDFLSTMESEGSICFHSDKNYLKDGVPSNLLLPKNLFIIGTVNIDETTYMFSPKVLDRANVIEFKICKKDMVDFLSNPIKPDLNKLKNKGIGMASDFVAKAHTTNPSIKNADKINSVLLGLFEELKSAGSEFGFRTAQEIYRLIAILESMDSLSSDTVIDIAVMQKLLPKLHGSRRKMEPVLNRLWDLCLVENENLKPIISDELTFAFSDSTVVKFPLSIEKIHRMYLNALKDGFTSYAEA